MGTKKRFKGRGSGISRKDIGSKHIPKIDPDYHREVVSRFKIPPARIPKEMTKEHFIEEMEFNPEDNTTMSTEEFTSLLRNPKYRQRRRARTQKERMMQAMEYFDIQDEYQWVTDQMKILDYVDEKRFEENKLMHKWRTTNIIEQIEKRHKQIKREDPALAKVFAEAGWNFITSIKKPRKRTPAEMVIVRQQRRYALEGNYYAMRSLAHDLNPFLGG